MELKMPSITISNYKSYLDTLTKSNVNNLQVAQQIQYKGWELAGQSKPYSIKDGDKSTCGKWAYYGCKNTELHTNNLLTKIPNPVFIKPTKFNCNRLRCKECYTRASFFRSTKITKRIKDFRKTAKYYNSNLNHMTETHVVVSPRVEINDTYISIREKVVKLLRDVGVIGGVLVVHHFRKDAEGNHTKKGLHFHCVGYADRARVDGLEVKRQFKKENFAIVHNKGRRRSTQKTISYLLNHCSINDKHHSITWFGKLSYSNMKISGGLNDYEKLEKIRSCPICQSKLVKLTYVGIDRPPDEISYGMISDWRRN